MATNVVLTYILMVSNNLFFLAKGYVKNCIFMRNYNNDGSSAGFSFL